MVRFSQALARHRRRLHGQGRAPSPAPAHLSPAGLPGGARLHSPSCGRSPHSCQRQAPHRFSLGLVEAHDIGPGGAQTERLRASGAIATAATHPAHGRETVASRHTWQVAMQVAAGRALHYAEQLRRKGKQVTISLPSATTARDILPTRPGETRPRTSHRDIASNNSRKLQQLGTQVKINVDTANAPQRLQHEAEAAARSGDLRAHVRVPGRAVHAIPLWDELRTWDPGD